MNVREADTIPTDSVPSSDRRYSDNLQSGRPSTSLARLAYVEIVEIGNKLEWVEALDMNVPTKFPSL